MPRNAATQNNNTENMEQHVPFKVTITEHNPERGVLANADVNVAGIMTIRNVKIKQDDYGLTVTMPRTKMREICFSRGHIQKQGSHLSAG